MTPSRDSDGGALKRLRAESLAPYRGDRPGPVAPYREGLRPRPPRPPPPRSRSRSRARTRKPEQTSTRPACGRFPGPARAAVLLSFPRGPTEAAAAGPG